VVYDACVLYPAPLRDLLMRLALTDLYRARWTNLIHDEWIRSVLRQRPDLTPDDLERTRSLMNAHVRDCLITGFEHLIPTIRLPDPDDRHVVAAAIHGGASLIVTFNVRDFPPGELAPYGLATQHPGRLHLRTAGPGPCPGVRSGGPAPACAAESTADCRGIPGDAREAGADADGSPVA
jgi:hypothetical protein